MVSFCILHFGNFLYNELISLLADKLYCQL